jgi:hypothetical protein
MHGNNQPIAVVPDIENHKTVHIVSIGKAGSKLLEVPPPGRFYDFDPRADLPGSLTIPLARLLKALDRDDVHNPRLLRGLRSVKGKGPQAEPLNPEKEITTRLI